MLVLVLLSVAVRKNIFPPVIQCQFAYHELPAFWCKMLHHFILPFEQFMLSYCVASPSIYDNNWQFPYLLQKHLDKNSPTHYRNRTHEQCFPHLRIKIEPPSMLADSK
mmetsp:Transcript_2202/g.3474  ORF Transcript_2202/g.3474 Transcript_2202/m.3474 type:complete len:108 (+) Transcript_2202:169-492(+)